MHQIVSGDDQVHEIQDEISDSVLSFNTEASPCSGWLGEDDEVCYTLKAAFRKAEMKAQEPPLSEQICATRSFIGRKLKRVDEPRLASDRLDEILL